MIDSAMPDRSPYSDTTIIMQGSVHGIPYIVLQVLSWLEKQRALLSMQLSTKQPGRLINIIVTVTTSMTLQLANH